MRPKNYLNNRDILAEIHKSKSTYCIFLKDDDHRFDLILPNVDKINIRTIAQAKRNRADRTAKEAHIASQVDGEKTKLAEFAVDWKKVSKYDLIFRIMTFDHVPLQPGRKKNPKTIADHHVQCNFPPFQHFRFNEEDELICVGKSHWVGGLHNGYFGKIHGQVTNKLANMYMKLCDRYATRFNWRGYSFNDEMKSSALVQLSQVGLQFNEDKSQNPFAYYTSTINNSFTRVLNTEKRARDIRDDILEMNGLTPSFTRQMESTDEEKEIAKNMYRKKKPPATKK